MDRLLSYVVRCVVWFSALMKPLSRLGLCHYEEWKEGERLKILLVGYNGARNTGADARVVALTQQLEEALGAGETELTVMTLDTDKVRGYFSENVRLYRFTTLFFFSLLRALSRSHVAVLCEGSTLTRTFADALCVFYCEAAGIMKRQHKPCIAYGSEVGHVDGWLARLSCDMMSDTYFMVRTEASLKNLRSLGLQGHVGTDTAWTFQTPEGAAWAHRRLVSDGWDGQKPLLGVAVVNPFCWPVRPSLWRWLAATVTGDHTQQYDKMYFFSDSHERRHKYRQYLEGLADAANRYQREYDAYIVILGMEQLDTKACCDFEQMLDGPHAVYTSLTCDVFQMTGLLRLMSVLITSRYHAAVLSMEHCTPIVAVTFDARLEGVVSECELDGDFLHRVDDDALSKRIMLSLNKAEEHRGDISDLIDKHLYIYKDKTRQMAQFFTAWLKKHFS